MNNAHEYTNEQLQAAIDAAFPSGALADCGVGLDNFPNQSCWEDEAPNRLAIARAFLAALPQPEAMTADEGATATSDPYARLKAYNEAGARIRCGLKGYLIDVGWSTCSAWQWSDSVDKYEVHPDDLHLCPEYAPKATNTDLEMALGGQMYWRDLALQLADVWWKCYGIGASLQHGDLNKDVSFSIVCEKHGGRVFHADTPHNAWLKAEEWLMSPDRGANESPALPKAAEASAEPPKASADDGPPWIPHDGGLCPLKTEEVEEWEYRLRNDGVMKTKDLPIRLAIYWQHDNHPHDIIAYRVIKWKPGHGPQAASKADEPAPAETKQPDYTITATPGVTVHVPAGQTAKFKPDGWNQEAKQLLDAAFQPPQPWTPRPGDVVRLKSGGPEMTVSAIGRDQETGGQFFVLVWMSQDGFYHTCNANFLSLTPTQPAA